MCTSTRTLMSAVSIWPGSTWLTLWLEEATSDDGIPADDEGQGEDGGRGATCTCSCCPCTGWAEELAKAMKLRVQGMTKEGELHL